MLSLRINRGDDLGFFMDGSCVGIVRSHERVSLNLCFHESITIKRVNIMTKEEFLCYEAYVKDNIK